MITLPEDYLQEMQTVFGEELPAYEACFARDAFRGISVNRLKITPEALLPLLPFPVTRSPFYRDGYYVSAEEQGIGKLPLHHAGAFYVQEPSASSAVSLLGVRPGDRVLDLCAAPGGKSAQIASCLEGSGLIWSNEVVRSRAQILLSNYERMGIRSGVVSSLYPEVLCSRLSGFFDRVLVDAPCSGEGMFRKDPAAVAEWSREHVLACARRQLSILDSAAEALRSGGTLVYSTCTFSPEENEGVIRQFLESHPDFTPGELTESFGRPTGVSCGIRITPLENGEGHFAAILRKTGDASPWGTIVSGNLTKSEKQAADELLDIFRELPHGRLKLQGDKLYLLPELYPETAGVNVIRAGVFAGEFKKNRFEPAHSLFTAFPPSAFRRVLALDRDDPRAVEFLNGYEIDCDGDKGYTAVSYCGMVMGFGKCSGGRLKNKYPKGLRTV